jgi:hypothetical protein
VLGSCRCGNPKRVGVSEICVSMRTSDGPKRRLIDTLRRRCVRRVIAGPAKRVRGDRAKSWSRPLLEYLRRVNPKGASSGRRVNHTPAARDSRKGQSLGIAAYLGRPNASAAGAPVGQTVCGLFRSVTRRIPFERRKLRRVNPKSAAGVKQNRHGIEGRKPSRG